MDELVALHQDLGIFAILDELQVQRARAGIADELLLHTLATLPFVEQASLSGASEGCFLTCFTPAIWSCKKADGSKLARHSLGSH